MIDAGHNIAKFTGIMIREQLQSMVEIFMMFTMKVIGGFFMSLHL